MQGHTTILLLVLASIATAGCIDNDASAGDAPIQDDQGASYAPRANSFEIVEFNVTTDPPGVPAYEDARLLLHVVVRNAAENGTFERHFVTLRADGEVLRLEDVGLAPGQEAVVEDVFVPGAPGEFHLDAKVGADTATAVIDLAPRPRVGEEVTDENLSFRVNAVVPDGKAAHANVTLTSHLQNDTIEEVSMRQLCRAADGRVHETESVLLEAPDPGNLTTQDVSLPACRDSETPHGVLLQYRLGDWEPHAFRVLYRDPGGKSGA